MATIHPAKPANPEPSRPVSPPEPIDLPTMPANVSGLRSRPRSSIGTFLLSAAILNAVAVLVLTVWNFIPGETVGQKWRAITAQEVVTPTLPAEVKFSVPDYDYKPWNAFPAQVDGRTKPFQSAATEAVWSLHGRGAIHGAAFPDGEADKGSPPAKNPVAVVLNWMLLQGTGQGTEFTDWEDYPFILCEHRGLRAWIFLHRLENPAHQAEASDILERLRQVNVKSGSLNDVHDQIADLSAEAAALMAKATIVDESAGADPRKASVERKSGMYIAPHDLRHRPASAEGVTGLELLMNKTDAIRREDKDKAMQYFTPEQSKASEVARRLNDFDSICQNNPPGLNKMRQHDDPIKLVALDRVPGAGEFSLGDAREILRDPANWRKIIQERLHAAPQEYIRPERRAALLDFQAKIKAGQGDEALKELTDKLAERDAPVIEAFRVAAGSGKLDEQQFPKLLMKFDLDPSFVNDLKGHLQPHIQREGERNTIEGPIVARAHAAVLADQREKRLDEFKKRIDSAKKGYNPTDLRFRMLHLDFLELTYPDLYEDAARWQPAPKEKCDELVKSFDELKSAYTSKDADKFKTASEAFFATCKRISDTTLAEGMADAHQPEALRTAGNNFLAAVKANEAGDGSPSRAELRQEMAKAGYDPTSYVYPYTQSIGLELAFNKIRPFMWGWVLMVPAVLLFALTFGAKGTTARICYIAGLSCYAGSLGFQLFGFYARVAIAGRPPVSNMYETVIFVAFMSGVFALILEAVYRKTLFALAGAVVSTISLVLADQLPLVLDPKISPLTPVLRSNTWLIVHVMTIVASYAGGTLAWGLGNISLALLAFGRPKADTVKTLANYTRRALEIAILLLATGTFLGGVWAAYSWGRFWGWDPKETWALIALVVYVIPLHARYVGWVKDYGLAVGAVLCYAAIVMCWYGVNFVLGAGLHSYGFGGGGPWWVLWAGLLNVQWVILATMVYQYRKEQMATAQLAGV